MNRSKVNLFLSVLAVTVLALPVLGTALWTDAMASKTDREPPVVMVHTAKTLEAGAPLIISAQIVDPSGIGRVALWVRGEHEEEFRQLSMEQVAEDQVQAEIPPWPERGSQVAYYIEAQDAAGNGPAFAGAPRTPYVIQLKGVESAPAPADTKTNWLLWAVTAVSLIALVGGYFFYRRFSRGRLHAELNAELNRLAGFGPEPEPKKKAPAKKPVQAKRRSHVPQNPAEQAFWIRLLSPISDMGGFDRDHALKSISARAHHHPTLGKRFFDVGTLTRHLEWVERGDIQLTAEMVADERRPAPTSET